MCFDDHEAADPYEYQDDFETMNQNEVDDYRDEGREDWEDGNGGEDEGDEWDGLDDEDADYGYDDDIDHDELHQIGDMGMVCTMGCVPCPTLSNPVCATLGYIGKLGKGRASSRRKAIRGKGLEQYNIVPEVILCQLI